MGEIAAREKVFLEGFPEKAAKEGHLNARGHTVAADLVSRFLCDEVIRKSSLAKPQRWTFCFLSLA